jgi:general secretion pathway protein F
MPRYRFEALNADGAPLDGSIAADSEREAARMLDRRGLSVLRLAPEAEEAVPRSARARRLRLQDMVVAFHELATMLQSGVTLVEAVSSQKRSSHHPRLLAAFEGIGAALRRGQSFSDALAAAMLPLPGYFMTLVRAGEQSG